MPFQIVHNDITQMHTDVIVNTANCGLIQGGGVCGAVFAAAGAKKLQKACSKIAPCPTGQSVITKGYDLSAKYIIHTVGPVWHGGTDNEKNLLISAYQSALELAAAHHCQSIAFPLISSGIYGYPQKEALEIAVSTIRRFLEDHEMDVYLVVFSRDVVKLSEQLYDRIKHYINRYAPEIGEHRRYQRTSQLKESEFHINYPADAMVHDETSCYTHSFSFDHRPKPRKLETLLSHMEETFSEMLFRLIDEKGFSDVEVYKRSNIDRKLFSKIKSNKNYTPKKQTIFALAIGMQLSLDETVDLLKRAGYSFSGSNKFDIIIRYFIENEQYDIYTINEALFYFEQPTLGI